MAGYVSNNIVPTDRLYKCLKQMRLRGPDDNGLYENRDASVKVGLVHTRLSILDLDPRSAQPFHFQHYVFSYNGEIYNYLELRAELEDLGYSFRTNGDTEVMAIAWAAWGKDALNKFDGMWAIAVWDAKAEQLTLATDPFGEKPIYYIVGPDNSVFFGSQIDCALTLANIKARPNWQHLKRYLVNGYKSIHKTDDSYVEHVRRLPGNKVMEVSTRGINISPYWKVPDYRPDRTQKRADLVASVRETLISSVAKRMRADVPLAFCMSGGIDSNSIIAIASQHLGMDVCGFTIMNKDGRYDEQKLVDLSSRELDVQNEKIVLQTTNFLPALEAMIKNRHGPVSTISYYTQNFLHKAISDRGYKVAISGTGADELFTGYYDHHLLYLGTNFEEPLTRAHALENWEKYTKPQTRNPLLQDPDKYLRTPGAREHVYYKNTYYADFLRDAWHEPFVETIYCGSLMRNRMLNELFHEAVPVILAEDDKNAMAYSIENRSPFLSRELLEMSMTIPDAELIKDGYAKSILREAMAGLVPDQILYERRKIGFNSSLFEVADIKSDHLRQVILDDSPFYDVVDRGKVEEFLGRDLSLNSDSKFLFNLINAKITVDFMEA
ncbi:asparagine synthase (glutamine-hydrolyzing) [Thalassospira sp. HJ]|uniref:asparagine synthase (glutamine-hydrolyzing) n=1 Tax=Thalassospira sp. HJ TaxID=1616823 RepID=UPI0013791FC7|nr:asparagine synthase (glutamine-hydrolyzing) [Thalassospira sp. HJ]